MPRVDYTKRKGRGVFAEKRYQKGELIERVPVAVIPNWQWYYVEKTILVDYCYFWGDEMAFPFGAVIFYNHSYSPNAFYTKKLEERVIETNALQDIEAGEEILVNYNGDPEDNTPLWFEVMD
jgi:uncharacterized protein